MDEQHTIIDFKELVGKPSGEALESLVRELGNRGGLRVSWSGRGADGGRDLTFSEIQKGPLSDNQVKWLVQCKDNAKSGKAVTESAVGSILDKVNQHRADGYLLATTTTVGTALKEKLDSLALRNGGQIHTLVWDFATLSMLIVKPDNADLFKLYFPNSYKKYLELDIQSALEILEKNLPKEKYEQISQVIQPVALVSKTPSGKEIWPFESATSNVIDDILHSLINDSSIKQAIALIEGIDNDALLELYNALKAFDDDLTFQFVCVIIRTVTNPDIVLNSFQFLSENYEVNPKEVIELASYLDDDGLEVVYGVEISSWLSEEAFQNGPNFEFYGDIDELSTHTYIEDIFYESISFEREKERIKFHGAINLDVECNFGSSKEEASLSYSFPGKFSGYFDPGGIYIESITVDTSKYYE